MGVARAARLVGAPARQGRGRQVDLEAGESVRIRRTAATTSSGSGTSRSRRRNSVLALALLTTARACTVFAAGECHATGTARLDDHPLDGGIDADLDASRLGRPPHRLADRAHAAPHQATRPGGRPALAQQRPRQDIGRSRRLRADIAAAARGVAAEGGEHRLALEPAAEEVVGAEGEQVPDVIEARPDVCRNRQARPSARATSFSRPVVGSTGTSKSRRRRIGISPCICATKPG